MKSNPQTSYKKLVFSILLSALLFVTLSAVSANNLRAAVKISFLYNLADFTGPIRYSTPRLSIDKERNEISVLFQNTIRIFNDSGMEVYRFADDLGLGYLIDMTVDPGGNILLLSYKWSDLHGANAMAITRCNFRGEPLGQMTLKNLPAAFSQFGPNRMVCRNGKLYFVNLMDLKVLITDLEGNFEKGFDLFALLELQEKDRGTTEIFGLNVADDGSILFTIPVLFTAYRLYLDGKIDSFGRPGGAPGRFNIVSGIALDSKGNYLVVDKLKCTIMVFDSRYNYITQFGFRGVKSGNLIAPDDIAIDGNDRVYVTQNGKRGVSVYRMSYE